MEDLLNKLATRIEVENAFYEKHEDEADTNGWDCAPMETDPGGADEKVFAVIEKGWDVSLEADLKMFFQQIGSMQGYFTNQKNRPLGLYVNIQSATDLAECVDEPDFNLRSFAYWNYQPHDNPDMEEISDLPQERLAALGSNFYIGTLSDDRCIVAIVLLPDGGVGLYGVYTSSESSDIQLHVPDFRTGEPRPFLTLMSEVMDIFDGYDAEKSDSPLIEVVRQINGAVDFY